MTKCYILGMQTTIRTTLRIRKDLLDQSRLLALKQGSSLQDVINEILIKGFGNHITDLDIHKVAMQNIDRLRERIRNGVKSKSISTKKLIEHNKKELESRTLNTLKFK
jgi:hypothetical protein